MRPPEPQRILRRDRRVRKYRLLERSETGDKIRAVVSVAMLIGIVGVILWLVFWLGFWAGSY